MVNSEKFFRYYTGGAVQRAIFIAFFDEVPQPGTLLQACQ
jgi:hypothetical protein